MIGTYDTRVIYTVSFLYACKVYLPSYVSKTVATVFTTLHYSVTDFRWPFESEDIVTVNERIIEAHVSLEEMLLLCAIICRACMCLCLGVLCVVDCADVRVIVRSYFYV